MKPYRLICFALFCLPALAAAPDQWPWEKAQAVLNATEADITNGGGFDAVARHLSDLEQAMATADAAVAAAKKGKGDTNYVLTDGPAGVLGGLIGVAADHESHQDGFKGKTVAVPNPYMLIALYLGSYYNEKGRFEDAVKVMSKGLLLDPLGIGEHRPPLLSERAVALTQLNRFTEALADYDEGLKLVTADKRFRARMYRGRGYALTELERLDEAEAAYNESLKLEPGNAMAQRELAYIAKLRAGGAKLPSAGIKVVDPPKN